MSMHAVDCILTGVAVYLSPQTHQPFADTSTVLVAFDNGLDRGKTTSACDSITLSPALHTSRRKQNNRVPALQC